MKQVHEAYPVGSLLRHDRSGELAVVLRWEMTNMGPDHQLLTLGTYPGVLWQFGASWTLVNQSPLTSAQIELIQTLYPPIEY